MNLSRFEQRVFTVEQRETLQTRLLDFAQADSRIVAGALIGSLSLGAGDRWSDLDLTFGVASGVALADVLADWTAYMIREWHAVVLFDLPHRTSIYRVFLTPQTLQVDLSFTPESDFGALGPKFHLLFGKAVERAPNPKPTLEYLYGLAVHHAVRARFCIERERYWQAEYWISGVRDTALMIVCQKLGLESNEGRGYDRLPKATLALAEAALVGAIRRDALLRGLHGAVALLLHESGDLAAETADQLHDLTT
jgi:hypothetical protein